MVSHHPPEWIRLVENGKDGLNIRSQSVFAIKPKPQELAAALAFENPKRAIHPKNLANRFATHGRNCPRNLDDTCLAKDVQNKERQRPVIVSKGVPQVRAAPGFYRYIDVARDACPAGTSETVNTRDPKQHAPKFVGRRMYYVQSDV